MTTTTLVTTAISNLLGRAKYSKDKTNIPNEHSVMQSQMDNLMTISEALGIDFQATEYTYTVVKRDEGQSIYAASVMSDEGKASVFWGKVKQPIAAIKKLPGVEVTLEEAGKGFALEVTKSSEDGQDAVTFTLPVIISKKLTKVPDKAELRAALRNNTLGNYLMTSFVKAKKLKEVTPGTYKVTGYNIRYFNGDPKVELEVEGVGLVAGNTELQNKIMAGVEITPEQPATLEIRVSTRMTTSGHPIIPVILETYADSQLPVYDFSDEEVYVPKELVAQADDYDLVF